jgi:glycosyltransferase involved in cell wall biosynthesis
MLSEMSGSNAPDSRAPTPIGGPAPDRKSAATPRIGDFEGLTVLLDCRWLGHGGAGRVTELLLGEMRDRPPASGRWILWGDPAAMGPLVFDRAVVEPWHGNPARLYGQADWLRVPRADVRVYLHQIRPLLPGRSVTLIHDTIPLHFEARTLVRLAKLAFFKVVGALSSQIITVSAQSKEAITRDLGVNGSRIIVVGLSVDAVRVARIRAMRATADRSDTLLYVGRFGAHKNLERLCRAYATTEFRSRGGRLLLVGGSPAEVRQIGSWIHDNGIAGVETRGFLPEPELDRLFATSRALVQPSLEEGYGLPAVEAAAVGLPVAASRSGYASEIPGELVTFMDPRDERSVAAAIDVAVARSDPEAAFLPRSTLREGIMEAVARVARPAATV